MLHQKPIKSFATLLGEKLGAESKRQRKTVARHAARIDEPLSEARLSRFGAGSCPPDSEQNE